MPNNQWDIDGDTDHPDGNPCNPWAVNAPDNPITGALIWQIQVTAPLPLEAINDLLAAAIRNIPSPLLAISSPGTGVVSVTQKFFQSSPNGISSNSVQADVLGLLSLVLSYVKRAPVIVPPPAIYDINSPKISFSIMPRTEFVALFAQVQGALPGKGTLYDLVKVLACYENDEDDEVA